MSGELVALFGSVTPVPKSLAAMWAWHGRGPTGAVCRDCRACVSVRHGRRAHVKCLEFGISRGAGTDWRAKWPACGKYQP